MHLTTFQMRLIFNLFRDSDEIDPFGTSGVLYYFLLPQTPSTQLYSYSPEDSCVRNRPSLYQNSVAAILL
jgi:hypothetical protein